MSRYDKIQQLEIFKKAELIFQLVESLAASLPEDDDYLQSIKGILRADAMMIPAKIMGAEGGDLYSIRMQNAAIIREHAMSLHVQIVALLLDDNCIEESYIRLIRNEIQNFRLLFIEWVQSFDTNNHIWDEWELFNPPGATPPSEEDNNNFNINDFFDDLEED